MTRPETAILDDIADAADTYGALGESIDAKHDRDNRARMLQDACNPRGIARELVRQIDHLCEFGGSSGIRGDLAIARILDKLQDMNGRIEPWPLTAPDDGGKGEGE